MGLVSLVYVSFASNNMDESSLHEILRVSRENNQAAGLTGMLLYHNRLFIQALEGEESLVDPLFRKICKDPRHRNVVKIFKENIRERSFGDWAMGFNTLDKSDVQDIEGYTDFLAKPNAEFFTSAPSSAKLLLRSFARKSR